MRLKNVIRCALIALAVVSLASCELLFAAASALLAPAIVQVSFDPLAPLYDSPIQELPPDSGDPSVSKLDLPGLEGQNVFLVKVNTSDKAVSAGATGSVAGYSARGVYRSATEIASSAEPFAVSQSRETGGAMREVGLPVTRLDHPAARDFRYSPSADQARFGIPSRASEAPVFAVSPAVGKIKQWKIEVSPESYDQFTSITATLRAQGQYCNIWIHNSRYSESSAVNDDNLLSQSQAEAAASRFDAMYQKATALLGYEYGKNPGDPDGGLDGDARVQILLYDIYSDYGPNQNSGVLGMFWGKDFYDAGPGTNRCEVLYMDAHFLDNIPDYSYSTLVHELQHMINFSRNGFNGQEEAATPIETWYNEMLSMLTEDMIYPTFFTSKDAVESYPRNSRIPLFLANTGGFNEAGLTEWKSGDAVYVSYGYAYSFGAYLARNWGGVGFVRAMVESGKTGKPAIDAALASLGKTERFTDVFTRFAEAYIFSGSALPTGVASFSRTPSSTTLSANGLSFDYDLKGFDIWEMKNYVKEYQGENVPKDILGPYVWGLGLYDMRPCSVDVQSCADWQRVEGDLQIQVTLPSDQSVRCYVMVR